MEVYRISSRLFLLLGLLCLAVTLQGVQGGAESEGPSESECRPYIEKALKELETAEASEPIAPGDDATGDSKEDVSTVEITTDDSVQAQDDGDNEDDAQESKESPDSAEIEQGEVEEADDEQSAEQKDEETSVEEETVSSTEDETQPDVTEEEPSKEEEEEEQGQEESEESVQEDKETSAEEDVQSVEEEVEAGSEEDGDKRESGETDESAEDQAPESEEKQGSAEDDTHSEEKTSAEDTGEAAESAEEESKEDTRQSAESGQESAEERPEAGEQSAEEESAEEQPVSEEESSAEEQPASKEESSAEEQPVSEEQPSAEEQPASEEEPSAEEQPASADESSAEDKSAETVDAEQISIEEGESAEDAKSDAVDEERSGETEGEDTKETEGDDERTSAEEGAKEDESTSKEDGDKAEGAAEDTDSEVQKDSESVEEVPVESESPEKESSQEVQSDEQQADEPQADEPQAEKEQVGEVETSGEDKEALDETAGEEQTEEEDESEEKESAPEEELINEGEIPDELRPTEHIRQLLKLDDENSASEKIINGIAEITLRELKKLYENAIKPLETLYKYRDLSNRHFGDAEIFSKPLVLFMGPWSGGKSSIINYLVENEYNETSLRTGAEPSPAYFNILMYGQEPEVLDGTQLAADFTFSGLQKFGQGLEERLRGLKLPQKLLEKINIVEIPGILEVRKQISRVFPFNDACQWFIDRADIIFLVYDPSKLDVGPETEAILDQLKGREHQTRIILNKADQVKPEELMRVQGALIWNISPLMSSAQPPVMYTTSLWSRPYESWAPVRLLQAQERAFLRDLRSAIDKRIENKIASARRFAVRVRNHAKMVDCYLTTYYNHKSVFGNRKQVADAIIEHPQDYHIYEGLSTLTNISRYDLPDPDVYRDFFRLNPLYDFQQLSATCTYFRGCPINRLDIAIAYDLPELVGKHKRMVEAALAEANQSQTPGS